jgi:hypothetical protein
MYWIKHASEVQSNNSAGNPVKENSQICLSTHSSE